ncbi:MAG: hypothetical protein IKH04_05950 [Kiritimatiellae bacterium]|nr:hypothetical protein [Kiritimatiellia bacterium]
MKFAKAHLAPVLALALASGMWASEANVHDCTPEAGTRSYTVWEDASEAGGMYRGVGFTLKGGIAEVVAPAGKYVDDAAQSYQDRAPVRWRLETIPEWCFETDGMEGFLLCAQRLDANGDVGTGELAGESTLLLFWRDTTAEVYGGWMCAFGHLGVGLVPLKTAGAVTIEGGRLKLLTVWREAPVEYRLEKVDGTLLPAIFDRAASVNFDLAWQFLITKADADLEGKNREFLRLIGSNIVCRAIWRNPDVEDAYFDWIEGHRATRADAYDCLPELADGGGFALPGKDSRTLAMLYHARGHFEEYGIHDDEVAVPKLSAWRKEARPALLTVRLTDTKAGESADFSISRDGEWMVIESGYRMPAVDDQDGFEHTRITSGGCLYRIPENKRKALIKILSAFDRAPYL